MNRVKVDWLAGRSQAGPEAIVGALRPAFGPQLGEWLNLNRRTHGWQGYESSAELRIGKAVCGLVAWGGERQRGWTYASMSGAGCDQVADWDAAQEVLGALPAWQYRRVDLALDCIRGESSHEAVLQAYAAGQFTTRGRPPKLKQITGPGTGTLEGGRTIYIGKRENPKFLRCYEKGLQLLELGRCEQIDGIADARQWYRVEVELKPDEMPADVIERRDQYFAGSYPYLQKLMPEVDPEIFVPLRDLVPRLTLQGALDQVRRQYGSTLFTALAAYGGDIGAVMAKIKGDRHSDALLRAGVMLVDHDA